MKIEALIADIKTFLEDTFSMIDNWFDKDVEIRSYRPENGGWTINEILEHIGLTNHFLLILIDKGTKKSLNKVSSVDLQEELKGYQFQYNKLTEVGLHKSFEWIRPEHMDPKGDKSLPEVREQLKGQLSHCYETLEKLKNGEGCLYKTTMSVNNLGKIDVYEYIYFFAQHGQRHLTQMERNEQEYKLKNI